jgi:diguanylate cyclase (GGDEF)-like protein
MRAATRVRAILSKMQASTPADHLRSAPDAARGISRGGSSCTAGAESGVSSQPLASRQDKTDARTAFCLVARDGRIVASDGELPAWCTAGNERGQAKGDSKLREFVAVDCDGDFLAQTLDEIASVDLSGTLVCAADGPIAVRVELRRFDGLAEPLVLAAITRVAADGDADPRDALTQLPDRTAIARRAAAWRQAAPDAGFAVLFLDLDGFKAVNDRHGHAVGDAVLVALAARWQQCVREGDLVARYGGDEFVVLVRKATEAADVEPVIRRLSDATRTPVVVGDVTLDVQATIGWAAAGDATSAIDALVAAADADMYARKRRVLR